MLPDTHTCCVDSTISIRPEFDEAPGNLIRFLRLCLFIVTSCWQAHNSDMVNLYQSLEYCLCIAEAEAEQDRDADDVTFTDLDIGGAAAPPLPPQAPPLPSGLPPMPTPGPGPRPMPFPGVFFSQRPMQMHAPSAGPNHDHLVQAFKDLLLEVKVACTTPLLRSTTTSLRSHVRAAHTMHSVMLFVHCWLVHPCFFK